MSKFKDLMNSMKNVDEMAVAYDKANAKTSYDDNRYWKPSVDKAGNGYAIIRFLPVAEADIGKVSPADASVTIYSHGFKGPTGKWYIENSRTTINDTDPVSEYNSKLWNSGQQDEARKQKRKLGYVSNILVIKDEKQPETEGKVFLFSYGPKIKKKIEEALKPTFPDQPKFLPFDFETGANFKLRIRKGDGGFRNYDSSEFDTPGPLFGKVSDEAYEKIWSAQHSLTDLVTPDKFKSYAELKRKLEDVLGTIDASSAYTSTAKPAAVSDDGDDETPPWEDTPHTRKVAVAGEAPKKVAVATSVPETDEDEDEDLKMFKQLAS